MPRLKVCFKSTRYRRGFNEHSTLCRYAGHYLLHLWFCLVADPSNGNSNCASAFLGFMPCYRALSGYVGVIRITYKESYCIFTFVWRNNETYHWLCNKRRYSCFLYIWLLFTTGTWNCLLIVLIEVTFLWFVLFSV